MKGKESTELRSDGEARQLLGATSEESCDALDKGTAGASPNPDETVYGIDESDHEPLVDVGVMAKEEANA